MSMKKVLVTGGAGYIGSHCVRLLQEKGIEVVVLDNLSKGHKWAVSKDCKLIIGDVGDANLLDTIFRKESIGAVVHLAALSSVGESVKKPELYYLENVSKMIVLLDAMKRNCIDKIVFSSSAAIFGEPEYFPIDESHPKNPMNPYGKTKWMGEQILEDFYNAYEIRYCALRYFNAAGAQSDGSIGESHNPESHLIPLCLKTSLGKRGPLSVFGNDYETKDGTCIRDYVHVMDLAEAHYCALKYLDDSGGVDVFNLGTNTGYSVLEIIHEVEKVAGKPLDYMIKNRREGDPARLVASNEKASEILGWKPMRSSVEQIVKDAWKWELCCKR